MRSGFSPPGIMPTLVAIKTRSRAAFLQPRAHHAFGLAALVPRNPRRIDVGGIDHPAVMLDEAVENRSEEHTSELQSLMRISYAVFCLKKQKTTDLNHQNHLYSKADLSITKTSIQHESHT